MLIVLFLVKVQLRRPICNSRVLRDRSCTCTLLEAGLTQATTVILAKAEKAHKS